MKLKKTSLSLVALSILSCPKEQVFRYPTENLPFFYETKNLSIVEGKLHPFTLKSQREGEAEIEQLVQTAELEEAWLYIEEQESGQGIWLDIGETQTPYNVFNDVETVYNIINSIDMNSNGKTFFITDYHTHPCRNALHQELSNHETGEISVGSNLREIQSMPSMMDVRQHINDVYYSKSIPKNNNFMVQPSAVITPWGKFTYALSSLYFEKCRNLKTSLSYCGWYSERTGLKIVLSNPSLDYHEVTLEKTCEDLLCALGTLASTGVMINYTQRKTPPPLIFQPVNSYDSNFIHNLPF